MVDATETERIRAAQAGDQLAFQELVAGCQERVVHVAYGYLRNAEEAMDIAQDAFLKAYKALGRFNGQSTFWTWMYRITCNLCKDRLRQRARRPSTSLDALAGEDGELPFASGEETPRDAASGAEMESVVRKALESLPEKHRSVLILREFAGLSYHEIANVIGCRPGTVMSRLFHARQNLAEVLQPHEKTLFPPGEDETES